MLPLFILLGILFFFLYSFKSLLFNPSKKANFFFAWLIIFFYLFLTLVICWIILKPSEEKNFIYLPIKIKEINSRDRDYAEAFYSSEKTIEAYFFNLSNKKWYRDIYSNEILVKTDDVLVFNNGIHSPFVPLPSHSGDTAFFKISSKKTSLQFAKSLTTNNLSNIYHSPTHAPGALFSHDNEGIYNVQYIDKFYRLYYFDVKKGGNRIIKPPFNKGHIYSPYYWKTGDVLFYSGIYRKDGKFQTVLYIHSGDNPQAKVISWGTNLETPIIKISGNSSGQLFLHSHPKKKYPTLSDMKYYPFDMTLIEEKGIYALGYEIKFLELDKVYSFNFHPHHSKKLLVIGSKKGDFKNGLFLFELNPKPITKKNAWWLEGSLYVLLILLILFLYQTLTKLYEIE